MNRVKMYNHLIFAGILLMHVISHVSHKKSIDKHAKTMQKLYAEERVQRLMLEDSISDSLERINATIQNNFDKNIERIRAEIEFNKEIVDAIERIMDEEEAQ